MIDRILRRYISKEAELVLAAMEKIGGDPEKMSEYYLEREYNQMYDDVIDSEGFISRWALARTFARLQATRKRETKRARAAKSAAQILMGVDFKPQLGMVPLQAPTYANQCNTQGLFGGPK